MAVLTDEARKISALPAQAAIFDPLNFKSNVRETWRVILVSEADIFLIRITAHPRGAFISVGDPTPTETNLILLTT